VGRSPAVAVAVAGSAARACLPVASTAPHTALLRWTGIILALSGAAGVAAWTAADAAAGAAAGAGAAAAVRLAAAGRLGWGAAAAFAGAASAFSAGADAMTLFVTLAASFDAAAPAGAVDSADLAGGARTGGACTGATAAFRRAASDHGKDSCAILTHRGRAAEPRYRAFVGPCRAVH